MVLMLMISNFMYPMIHKKLYRINAQHVLGVFIVSFNPKDPEWYSPDLDMEHTIQV